jgi:hypothetical protein
LGVLGRSWGQKHAKGKKHANLQLFIAKRKLSGFSFISEKRF